MATARVERRLAAILAADVVGYSRLMERDEAGTFTRLKAIRKELVEPVLARHGGRFVDLKGDGAIVEFGSAVEAVEAAVEIQRAMLDRDPELPKGERIRYRIGINLGDVIVDGDAIYGDGVNVAARIESLCEPGGVWLSRSVHNQVRGKLDLVLVPSGLHQVKNISEAIETFRVALDGVMPAPTISRPAVASPQARRWLPLAAGALSALVLAAGGWHFWPREPPPAGKPAIAVLPFDNLGGDEATGRLADGITEDIITDLSRFRDLDVIARNSTGVYKGKAVDVRQVGRELGVRYVLEGSIQREADRLRLTTQLVDASSSAYVWSNRWDLPARDVFAAQTEVADGVASALGGYNVLAQAERAKAKRKRPGDLRAYDYYLLGVERKHHLTRESIEEAIRLLKKAVELAPGLARAHVALAHAHVITSVLWDDDRQGRLRAAEASARKALALDPQDAEAHAALAEALLEQGNLGAGAGASAAAEFERAIGLNPGSADILVFYAGWAGQLGEVEKGAELADRAVRLNPNHPPWYSRFLRDAYFFAGRYEDAIRAVLLLPEEQRGDRHDWVTLAVSHARLGRTGEASAAAAELMRRFPAFSAEHAVNTGRSFAREEDLARYLDDLRAAGLPMCAAEEDLARLDRARRLPECEVVERAKAAAPKT